MITRTQSSFPLIACLFLCASCASTPTQKPDRSVDKTASVPKSTNHGNGTCRVTFDGSGRVASAVMIKPTGNAILDRNTVDFAKKNWIGKPNTVEDVPIIYKLLKSGT